MPSRLIATLFVLLIASIPESSAAPSFTPMESSISDLQAAMQRSETSAVALVDWYTQRITELDQNGPKLNSIAQLNAKARADAELLDQERLDQGPRGPLHGIPILVKDNFHVEGLATTGGSALFKDFFATEDATLVQRLRDAGAVILGKTNMHEFAYGITTVGSGFGETRNAYDPLRNPGGSSGGTGAAIAANFAAVGLGSDTCGSIRIPSAYQALAGLRGTQGSSSRSGIIPLSSTQDIGGPLARSVRDLAIVLDAVTGYDSLDPQTASAYDKLSPGAFSASLKRGALQGQRFGLVSELIRVDPYDSDMADRFDEAVSDMRRLGAQFVDVSLPDLDQLIYGVDGGFHVLMRDFGHDLNAWLEEQPTSPIPNLTAIIESQSAHPEVQPLLIASAAMASNTSSTYLEELAKRDQLRTMILNVMAANHLDALIYPAVRKRPARLGESQPEDNVCQLSANSGLPAMVFPSGFTEDGLPTSIELLGRPWDDAKLLGFAFDYEQATHHRRPPRYLLAE